MHVARHGARPERVALNTNGRCPASSAEASSEAPWSFWPELSAPSRSSSGGCACKARRNSGSVRNIPDRPPEEGAREAAECADGHGLGGPGADPLPGPDDLPTRPRSVGERPLAQPSIDWHAPHRYGIPALQRRSEGDRRHRLLPHPPGRDRLRDAVRLDAADRGSHAGHGVGDVLIILAIVIISISGECK